MFGSKMSFECLCLCYLLDGWGLKDALIQNGVGYYAKISINVTFTLVIVYNLLLQLNI